MSNAVSRALNRAMGRVLPERQVFVRSSTRARYLHLSPMTQAGALALLLASAGWTGYATYRTVADLSDAERIALTKGAVERAWAARFEHMQAERDRLSADLAELGADHASASVALGKAKAALVEAEAALRATQVERQAIRRGLERLQVERNRAAERAEALEATLKETRLAMLKGATERTALAAEPEIVSSAMLGEAMARVVAERDAALAERSTLDTKIAALTERLANWRERQDTVMSKIEDAARAGLDGLDKVLARAGLDIEAILEETRASYTGAGGPFVPLTPEEAAALDAEGEDHRVAALMGELERINLMRVAIDRLPFGLPVRGARFTSGFGKRRDPFRRRWSMHNGVDYAAPMGTPITATAEGVVSFSGRMRGYGNVVIIRHSFGYETRYAHLKRALVTVGDRVARGDRIALMGSTGRSSGSHLHYEIRIDEDPINPKKFIEATRDVL